MASKPFTLNVTGRSSSNECIVFEIKIDNFSSLRNMEAYGSSELQSTHDCKSSWKIVLTTTRNDSNYYHSSQSSSMQVGLKRTDFNDWDVKASLFFEIQNSYAKVYQKESFEKIFPRQKQDAFYCNSMKRPSHASSVTGMKGNSFIINDNKLIIKGSIFIHNCCPKKKTESDRDSAMNLTELQSNLKYSYQNNLFSDVSFSFGDDNLYGHKTVLSARSPVFKKMFEQNMKEKNLSNVTITDIEKSVFDVFLIFLYTGVIENREFDTVVSLYSTADKYEVTTLFKTCSNILASYIANKTVSVILKLADMHNDNALKEKAIQFICESFTQIESTCEWNNLLDTDPRLASHTLKMVSSHVAAKERSIS
ncbi:TD and POZ domain-containing protein 3-like [Parasteatoda tepidariorum]|uniref:TD and POZ domain-containing protein 3-like n=1 Tax=Parasteatoda tepidariorum TaxID=114398 RepID=UPI00077FA534